MRSQSVLPPTDHTMSERQMADLGWTFSHDRRAWERRDGAIFQHEHGWMVRGRPDTVTPDDEAHETTTRWTYLSLEGLDTLAQAVQDAADAEARGWTSRPV